MITLGITGGIGSGKSYLCALLEKQGIPVFYTDTCAKQLIQHDVTIKKALKQLVGDHVYNVQGDLQKKVLAAYICRGNTFATRINAIVHPHVAQAWRKWCLEQTAPLGIMECALLFESGFDSLVSHTLYVTAPHLIRLQRVVKRDHTDQQTVQQWMDLQGGEELAKRAQYTILNDGIQHLEESIKPILESILHEKEYSCL